MKKCYNEAHMNKILAFINDPYIQEGIQNWLGDDYLVILLQDKLPLPIVFVQLPNNKEGGST